MQEQVWRVDLPADHPEYQHVLLKRELPSLTSYTVVMVRLSTIMELHKGDIGYTLPPVNNWPEDKRDGLFRFLNPKDGACYMPRLHFHLDGKRRNYSKPQGFSFSSLLKSLLSMGRKPIPPAPPAIEPYVSFSNGRHRTYYLHHAGSTVIPVETELDSAELLQRHCGV